MLREAGKSQHDQMHCRVQGAPEKMFEAEMGPTPSKAKIDLYVRQTPRRHSVVKYWLHMSGAASVSAATGSKQCHNKTVAA